jgi:hypothetical protein
VIVLALLARAGQTAPRSDRTTNEIPTILTLRDLTIRVPTAMALCVSTQTETSVIRIIYLGSHWVCRLFAVATAPVGGKAKKSHEY